MTRSILRIVAVLSSAVLVVGVSTAVPAAAKKKSKKAIRSCAPFRPGDLGKEANTTVVTRKATADNPLELILATGPGFGFSDPDPEGNDAGLSDLTSRVFHNIQVDSKKVSDLFVRLEFPMIWDYDLYLRHPNGGALAWEWSFNSLNEVEVAGPLDSSSGGHAEYGASQIDGYRARRCEGFTVDVWSAMTAGGDVTMKLWLEKPEK